MAVLPLVVSPDPRLKQRSAEVDAVDDQVRRELNDMLDTMYACQGIGLAAVQVGIMKRMLVMDVAGKEGGAPQPVKMVNPQIIEESAEAVPYEEGCLSFPGEYAEIKRPAEVTIQYIDEENEIRILGVSGLAAVCVQHEIDHLDGITFVDHISRLKRDMILRRMKKADHQKKQEVDEEPSPPPGT